MELLTNSSNIGSQIRLWPTNSCSVAQAPHRLNSKLERFGHWKSNLFSLPGLILELDLEQAKEYIGQLTPAAGVRAVLHRQGETPYPEDDGFNIPPAYSTYIGIRQVSFNRVQSGAVKLVCLFVCLFIDMFYKDCQVVQD